MRLLLAVVGLTANVVVVDGGRNWRFSGNWHRVQMGFQNRFEASEADHIEQIGPFAGCLQSLAAVFSGQPLDTFEGTKSLFFMGLLPKDGFHLRLSLGTNPLGPG